MLDKKFRRISMRFLALTTPIYLGAFVILLLVRSQGYDYFSDFELLTSVVHVFGLQGLHWLILVNKKEVSRDYMLGMLWFMMYNNVFVFSYWVAILEHTRPLIYILAPMSVMCLFSLSTLKQAILYNFILGVCLAVSASISVMEMNQPYYAAGIDWIYIASYFVVSVWLANLSELFSKNREKLREVVRSEQASKKELEYTLKQLAQAHIQLEEVSYTDALTQIFNRRYFNQAIERAWGGAIISKQSLSLLMIDVDFFKKFNDEHGHQIGDDCLKQVAEVITSCLGRHGDEVCRYGGEEFVVILPTTNSDAAISVAERIRLGVAEHRLVTEQKTLDVTVSIGIATLSDSNVIERIDTLITFADEALYQAKNQGRNCTVHSARPDYSI